MAEEVVTLVNKQNGKLAFKLLWFYDTSHFDHLQRNSYYSLIWVINGNGKLKADFSEYVFEENVLMAFSPYQPFLLSSGRMKGIAMHFHSDFFCIHKHQEEVTCNGVLFNNIYAPPFITVDHETAAKFTMLTEQMKEEMQKSDAGQYEMLVSYLKIFLITASRLKTEQQPDAFREPPSEEPFILQKLKAAIEKDFKTKHSPSDYAITLNISAKTLAKITKSHFNKTLTELISERVLIEAKRELYLTNKPIKEIAYELGYDDEYYFSRFFKTNSNISPQKYRDTVGFGKSE
jgi:AraC-like DNA-binding protein